VPVVVLVGGGNGGELIDEMLNPGGLEMIHFGREQAAHQDFRWLDRDELRLLPREKEEGQEIVESVPVRVEELAFADAGQLVNKLRYMVVVKGLYSRIK